jgi:HD-GYP domain-containing protein (c-di-GMP phosphodiesterase class II)
MIPAPEPPLAERVCFVSPDIKGFSPGNSGIKLAVFDSTQPWAANVQREVLAVLVTTDSYAKENGDAIRKWSSENSHLILRIIILSNGPAELLAFAPIPRDLIRAVLPRKIRGSHLTLVVEMAIAAARHEIESIRLRSRLALSSEDLQQITEVGQALATEKDFPTLIGLILDRAKDLVDSDGGSIYLVEDKDHTAKPEYVRFMRSSLQLDADEFLLPINSSSIAGYVALKGEPLIIDDVYDLDESSEFSFNQEYDQTHNYYTKSMMVLPMRNHSNDIIGVLQLINRKKNPHKNLTVEQMKGDEVIPFSNKDYEVASSIAAQAAVAIDNQRLLDGQKKLLESFIRLIAAAIDSKSDYTGAHCERVPILTEMITRAACDATEGPLADFNLNEDEWYELRIAAGLHDCGKIVTPIHVMDKATKLQTIYDRIETVRARFEILRRDAQLDHYRRLEAGVVTAEESRSHLNDRMQEIDAMEAFIDRVNIGGEYLEEEKIQEIERIARETVSVGGETRSLLSEDEVYNLSIRKGTLTREERLIINGHMVETIRMLESLPFPRNLRRVPEYAGGHHERMDGGGYPKGLFAGDMSIPARIMAIADVFEALTARDRPYKPGIPLSRTMEIMGKMKQENHLDPVLFDFFVQSRVYQEYAERFLPPDLIDEVDEAALLAIEPNPYSLPPEEDRRKRWRGFLPEFDFLLKHQEAPDSSTS